MQGHLSPESLLDFSLYSFISMSIFICICFTASFLLLGTQASNAVQSPGASYVLPHSSCCTSKILTTYNEDCARASVRCGRICGRHQSKTPTLQSDFMKQNEIKLIKILIHKVATDGSAVDQSVDHVITILMLSPTVSTSNFLLHHSQYSVMFSFNFVSL